MSAIPSKGTSSKRAASVGHCAHLQARLEYAECRLAAREQTALGRFQQDREALRLASQLLSGDLLLLLTKAVSLGGQLQIPVVEAADRLGVWQALPRGVGNRIYGRLRTIQIRNARKTDAAYKKVERSRLRIQRTEGLCTSCKSEGCTLLQSNRSREPSGIQGRDT